MKIKSNLLCVYLCEGVKLLPGISYIDNPERFLAHPATKKRIALGQIEILEKKVFKEPVDVEEGGFAYENMPSKELLKELTNIFDLKVLEKIKKTDTRKTVLEKIETQIKKIKMSDE